jgi:ribosomal protein S8
MVIEGFRREIERKKAEEYEKKREAVPPSVKEILANPTYSELLNLALERDPSKKSLRDKILRGETLENEDFENLESYRQLIKEATDYSREIIERLTPDTIKMIANASPEFNKLVAQIGIDKVKEFLEAYLAKLYVIDKMGNTNKFNDLADKIKGIKEAEQKLQDIDNSLREACRKYGISESELAQIYKGGGGEKDIENLVYKRLSGLEKIWNFLKGGKDAEERIRELNRINEVNSEINKIHAYLIEVGKMIANAIFDTEKEGGIKEKGIAEARVFLSKALYGRIEKLGGGISFQEAVYSKEDLEREWEEYLVEAGEKARKDYKKKWSTLDQATKDSLRRGFMENLKQSRFAKKGGGVLDILMNMIQNWISTK